MSINFAVYCIFAPMTSFPFLPVLNRDTQYDVIMWEERKSGPEASGSLFCTSHIMTSYCVSITEETTEKSYLFVLYNKKKTPELNRVNNLFFSHPNIWKFEKVEILQISRVHDLYK
jgi:hypothetical protein